ncbi:Kinesin-like protein KIN-14Q [Cardamine amara subsp. amara]|uniref:Kinesin-like protein KIN-14Q n=1 Tax=Cardamine amara subsp. amara TaxID=228776 RepID=A0ABD1BBZ5_CARAN
MEDCCDQRYDPLLATDASSRRESFSRSEEVIVSSSKSLTMVDLDSNCELSNDVHMELSSPGLMEMEQSSDPVALDGKVVLGFSLASPDLVNCGVSPDIPRGSYEDSPEFSKKTRFSTELSLENGIDGPTRRDGRKTPAVKFSAVCQTFEFELSPESSFELPSPPGNFRESMTPVISINSGSTSMDVTVADVTFLKDEFFSGGETITTDAVVGYEDELLLYQTARLGNFAYKFQSLEPGDYFIDLHFAEIEFTEGLPGVRVFDIFIQGAKVISGLDLFSQVGANTPLVIADLRMLVGQEGELSIRLEGVTGTAILCGISIRKEATATYVEDTGMLAVKGTTDTVLSQPIQENVDCRTEEETRGMRSDCEQQKDMEDMKRMIDELKQENQQKSRECEEALNSLREIQNELMRKSMHVGSLAFAVEGQVKEKTRWFSSLRDLTRKLKIMKMEQIKLLEEASTYKMLAQDINEFSSHIQSRVKQDAELHENLKVKFVAGEKERKELYNKILELKGNIRVFCRCRPLNFEEIEAGVSTGINVESAKSGEVIVMSNGFPKKSFKFDSVFGPNASQADVFEDTAPFATSVIDGYNVCIFAYGQTGTGKTFTMEGTQHDRGVNYRTLENLFQIIKERENRYNYEISVSVLEVYNEQIRDLLASQSASAPKRFEIRQVSEGNHHVPGLVEAPVKSIDEVWDVLKTGSNARAVGKTSANEHSSRSHCIHCVMVKGENLLNGECTKSKLWLVDLAGSERVAKTEVQGERLKETQNINKSLSALGDVIFALANKSSHIPFRNSKLTHLLQDSLGGDSKTLMFVQISPNENDQSETLCSLNFASRVRGIELGPAKKQLDNTELLKYKQMVEKWKQDMKGKDDQIRKMEETMYGLEAKIKERDTKNKTLQEKVKELESQLLVERKLARQHVDTKIAEQQTKQQTEDENNTSKRPPLTNILLGSASPSKEMVSLTRPPFSESTTSYDLPPLPNGGLKYNDLIEKENNPEMAEQLQLPKKTGRFSICPKRVPSAPAPRRSSLAPVTSTSKEMVNLIRPLLKENTVSYDLPPLPNGGLIEKMSNSEMVEQLQIAKRKERFSICAKRIPPAPPQRRKTLAPMPFLPITSTSTSTTSLSPPRQAITNSPDEKNGGTNQVLCTSPKLHRSNGKTLTSILRRSMQKRMQMKASPRQQPSRRGGINVGMERVRLSIGSRGRLAHRVLLTNARKAGLKETQLKQERWI